MMWWSTWEMIQIIIVKFKKWSGLPNVHGAIDGTHFKSPKHVLYLKIISIIKHVAITW